jgi:hypothetical protein
MVVRTWMLWGFAVIGVAIVVLLAVIAYALLSGDDGGSCSLGLCDNPCPPGMTYHCSEIRIGPIETIGLTECGCYK